MNWKRVLTLDADRVVVSGDEGDLADAVRGGADLRIQTEFIHNEHIDVTSDRAERVREVAEFGVTYLVEDRWAAGIMSLRQPVQLPDGFGDRSSMSFFLYNQDGRQAIARPYLDGGELGGTPGFSTPEAPGDMPKYHVHDSWDTGTNAPSSNFTYDFDVFRYFVSDTWEEVCSQGPDGAVHHGSVDALAEAFSNGCAVKVGIRGLCTDLDERSEVRDHEVFVEAGSCYFYLDQKLFIAGTHPVVRIRPDVPMSYRSRGWDFGWLVVKTDGEVVYRKCDPYTLKFEDRPLRCDLRWFVR
jgi:hypothetical protein